MSRLRRFIAIATATGLALGVAPAALTAPGFGPASTRGSVARAADQSDNVKQIARFEYDGVDEADRFFTSGTDIDFSGKYVYAMQQGAGGGVHVILNAAKPKEVAFIPCPGGQNDVAVVKPGLLALGYHTSTCSGVMGGGVRLIDVKNPKRPKYLGSVTTPGGTHTLTMYPGKPIIYANPGGLPTNGGATQQIIDVSNPAKPEIAATFQPNRTGCHDFTFHFNKDHKWGFCAGAAEAQIWDVSDPLAPVILHHIVTPGMQFPHSVDVTDDGKYMVLGDEAIAGNDCVGGPTGEMIIYDLTTPAPVPMGRFSLARGPFPAGSTDIPDNDVTGPGRDTWCTAHLFNFIPGTYTLVASWYAGGMNVIDFTNPTQPVELAHFMGTGEDLTNYWSAYWYEGRIWANDRGQGALDVFEVKGLKEGDTR